MLHTLLHTIPCSEEDSEASFQDVPEAVVPFPEANCIHAVIPWDLAQMTSEVTTSLQGANSREQVRGWAPGVDDLPADRVGPTTEQDDHLPVGPWAIPEAELDAVAARSTGL